MKNLNVKSKSVEPSHTVKLHKGVESKVGEVEWVSEGEGFCVCPGLAKHSGLNAKYRCMVNLYGTPRIECIYSSCKKEVKAKSQELRRALAIQFKSSLVNPIAVGSVNN